jgi:hypothetical protein
MRIAMMAITTSNSIRVKALTLRNLRSVSMAVLSINMGRVREKKKMARR